MKILCTFDYEIFFGNNTGTAERSIIKPTYLLLQLAEKHKIKLVFFVDSGYLLKLEQYKDKYPKLKDDYDKIVNQLKCISKEGHDIQLHVHPHWEDSFYNGIKWNINSKRYKLHDFSENEINDIIKRYKNALTRMSGNDINAIRAGGWCIQPFSKLSKSLKCNNIYYDSTVFECGYNKSTTHYYNFKNVPQKSIWQFEDDPLIEVTNGRFTEIPISSYFVGPRFYWQYALTKVIKIKHFQMYGDGEGIDASNAYKFRLLTKKTNSVVSLDGIKTLFLQDAFDHYRKLFPNGYFNIIGHPKGLTPYSLAKFDLFLSANRGYIKQQQ